MIIDYIKNKLENVIAASNLLDEIYEEISKRAYNPHDYEKYKSNRNRKIEYYKIYVKNYVIFYVVRDNIMEVRRILYKKRNFYNLM